MSCKELYDAFGPLDKKMLSHMLRDYLCSTKNDAYIVANSSYNITDKTDVDPYKFTVKSVYTITLNEKALNQLKMSPVIAAYDNSIPRYNELYKITISIIVNFVTCTYRYTVGYEIDPAFYKAVGQHIGHYNVNTIPVSNKYNFTHAYC